MGTCAFFYWWRWKKALTTESKYSESCNFWQVGQQHKHIHNNISIMIDGIVCAKLVESGKSIVPEIARIA